MQNIETNVDGHILTLKIDLSKRGDRSASGKTILVASTQGNKKVPGHDAIQYGVNVYTK